MKIQIFKNGKGLIYGDNPKRISCAEEGILRVASAEISISPGDESIMPVLFNGTSGVYAATFTSILGIVYELEKVTIKGGRIAPPSQSAVEFMELRCRIEELEALYENVQEQIRELSNIFDTNSLNFLIK